jgi:aarF domain-containing kinase
MLKLITPINDIYDLKQVLKAEWGNAYMDKFEFFDSKPFAAASIGQVHLAQLKNSSERVAVKIQYPGVAKSITSDIDNLMTVLNVANILPKGLYVENVIEVVKHELMDECDYKREADCYEKFKQLVGNDPVFLVPKVYKELTTQHILVTELVEGEPFDKHEHLSQEQRNFVNKLFFGLGFSTFWEFYQRYCRNI